MGCAYVDGCLTAEQILKAAYYYGLAVVNSILPLVVMTFVSVSYNDIKHIHRVNVEVALYNSQNVL